MISNKRVKRYCREDISLINNYDKAIADKSQIWVCHHINEITFTRQELIKQNMYYNRPANELVFLTPAEHRKLHLTICAGADEWKLKHSKAMKGNDYNKGKSRTEFGRMFQEHYGINMSQDLKLYCKEYNWYKRHNNKCRWDGK